jgi:diphosphomevalonate decarboxylase
MSANEIHPTEDHPNQIYMVTVSAGTNIAVIKYWGKADTVYNTPINDSVSITLDQKDLCAVTTVAASLRFTHDRLWLNGLEDVTASSNPRFRACVDGVKVLATDRTYNNDDEDSNGTVTKAQWQSMHVHVSSYNTFPTAAGLASSAAGYAALVAALAQLMHAKEQYPYQLSTIARQGSGSACRSMYGGFCAWRQGTPPEWCDSIAEPICPELGEQHWPEIRAIILVVSDAKKDTSSTSGMSTSVATSALLPFRAKQVVPQRMERIVQAWRERDFETFGRITMQDSNQFHAVCLDTYPPIFYMNDVSRAIIRIVTCYNTYHEQIRAAYTFDAGPNAVLYCLEQHAVEIGALMLHYYYSNPVDMTEYMNHAPYASAIASYQLDPALIEACRASGCTPSSSPGVDVRKMYYTKAGPGPQVVTDGTCNLDPITGFNVYVPTKI